MIYLDQFMLGRGRGGSVSADGKDDQVAGANGRSATREVPQRIADELRALIVSGELSDGESLGREPDLVERFGVSRPSLREALRILEAEGLITVERGVRGGVVAHEPDQRMTARTAAMLLRARNVSLADVFEARAMLEPAAARKIASMPARARRAIVAELALLIDAEEEAIGHPEAFAVANIRFHERLVADAGNQTLGIVIEMLNEIVTRAVTAVSKAGDVSGSLSTRQRGIRSQRRLLILLEEGVAAAAEEHWRAHMAIVAKVMLGQEASTVIDLLHHYG
jgi:GntR family transcriptional regulator, transcriptional repressor for pyruvate dehydrogenase complex